MTDGHKPEMAMNTIMGQLSIRDKHFMLTKNNLACQ